MIAKRLRIGVNQFSVEGAPLPMRRVQEHDFCPAVELRAPGKEDA